MRRVLDQLVVRVEDDEAYLAVAEDTQLHGLLHQTEAALLERHLQMSSETSWRLVVGLR
jgi:hypothetical protein